MAVGVAAAVGSLTYVGFGAADPADPADHAVAATSIRPAVPCGAWGEIDENPSPGIYAAANEVAADYQEDPQSDYFTGVGVCGPIDTMTVWRIPGSAAFDAEMADVARRHGVGLSLLDSKYSAETLEATIDAIRASGPKGLHLTFSTYQPYDGGFVQLGVQDDAEEAGRLLAEYGDKVRVEGGVFFRPT